MAMTYRTRRRLNRVGTVVAAVVLLFALFWLCWVMWLERYVVYTREGATLDFTLADQSLTGEVAVPPAADMEVAIYFNEGSDALDVDKELTPLNGYYIDYDALRGNMEEIKTDLNRLKAGTPIMIELKGGYGSFYYTSKISGAISSASVNVAAVDELIQYIRSKGFYTIAKISAFRDYDFGNRNVPCGLYMNSRAGLWMDTGGCFWLDPTNASTIAWITSVVNEVRELGFNEIVLDNFRFPKETDKYIFNGDMDSAISAAATTILASCGSDNFVVSFGVATPSFPVPDGNCRLYLSGVEAKDVERQASQVTFENAAARLVFLCDTNDTRYDAYSAMRPLAVSEGIEAQKADMAENDG